MMVVLKQIFGIVFVIFIFLTHTQILHAQDTKDFKIEADVFYKATLSESVNVIQNIKLTNIKEFVYAPTYTITLRLKNIHDISARNSKGSIPFTLEESGNNSKAIRLEFPDKIIGVGETNSFSLSFNTTDYVNKSGNIHTVTIPSTSNISDFDRYTVQVSAPESFGKPSIVKPNTEYNSSHNTYTFTKNNLVKSGIVMVFGEKQYYFFKLAYNLENKNLFPVKTEIALPANTAYQQVLIENISPQPESVHKDKDGNYMAQYVIPAKTAYSVKVHVMVESSYTPRVEELDASLKKYYIRPQTYWESDSSLIKKEAEALKTPEEIYNYVVRTLAYNTTKTSENNERLGALKVLSKPYYAVCLEFADLFVALARSRGIPARTVEGYAVTQNDPNRPSSLFEDVLHAWPEYYDDERKTWVSVDPTWGNTTKGVDYFHTLDLDHVAFVRNGVSSTYPVPAGGYKVKKNSKDIEVSFIDASAFKKRSKLTVESKFSPFLEGNKITGEISVINKGNAEDAPQNATVFVNNKKVMSVKFAPAPPYGSESMKVAIPIPKYSLAASLTKPSYTVTIQDENGKILNSTRVGVFPVSFPFIVGGTVLVGSLIIFTFAFKTRRLPFQK